jgi:hypothetical protein
MDFENIDYTVITNRALGATGAIFLVSIADRELGKMGTPEKPNMLFEYRHYAYALLGALMPALMPPTKNKDDFSTQYADSIRAFSDGLLFFGASQLLEKQLPEYVQVNGVSGNFANYVLGEPMQASTKFAMQNYVSGANEEAEAVMLVERATGDRVFIDAQGNFVKEMREMPPPPQNKNSMQDLYTMNC